MKTTSLYPNDFQKQIDQCHTSGGGTVVIPRGQHRCGSLELKSGVTLYLEKGAILIGSENLDDYPFLAPTVNESTDIRALIYAKGATNISIHGEGIIDGGADRRLTGKELAKEPTRPELIFFQDCQHVSVTSVTLRNASFWTLHLMQCVDVVIDKLTIRNRKDRINTDGIDPDGCKRVRITNCDIVTGDDCIVLKSTEGHDCEDILVSDCLLETHCTALKLGTESIGNIRNVSFTNCIIKGSRMAFGLFMKDGGTFENIQASHLIIEDETEFPLYIDSSPRFHGESKDGFIRNVRLTELTLMSPGRLFINGSPDHPIENLHIHALQWTLTHHLKLGSLGKPPGSVRSQPDPNRICHEFAKAQFTLANITGLSLSHVQLNESREKESPDRTLFYTHAVHNSDIAAIQSGSVQWLSPEEATPFTHPCDNADA